MSTPVADRPDSAAGRRRAGLSRENRTLVIAVAGVLALVFTFVTSNVAANHQPKPHALPVGVVGSPQQVGTLGGRLDRTVPGGYKLNAHSSPALARTAILHRRRLRLR